MPAKTGYIMPYDFTEDPRNGGAVSGPERREAAVRQLNEIRSARVAELADAYG